MGTAAAWPPPRDDDTVIIWDTASWEPDNDPHRHGTGQERGLEWGWQPPRLRLLDNTVIIWDTESWQAANDPHRPQDSIWSVAWNGDGSRLASASDDNTVIIWDTESWEPETTLTDHTAVSGAWPGTGTAAVWPPLRRTTRSSSGIRRAGSRSRPSADHTSAGQERGLEWGRQPPGLRFG